MVWGELLVYALITRLSTVPTSEVESVTGDLVSADRDLRKAQYDCIRKCTVVLSFLFILRNKGLFSCR